LPTYTSQRTKEFTLQSFGYAVSITLSLRYRDNECTSRCPQYQGGKREGSAGQCAFNRSPSCIGRSPVTRHRRVHLNRGVEKEASNQSTKDGCSFHLYDCSLPRSLAPLPSVLSSTLPLPQLHAISHLSKVLRSYSS